MSRIGVFSYATAAQKRQNEFRQVRPGNTLVHPLKTIGIKLIQSIDAEILDTGQFVEAFHRNARALTSSSAFTVLSSR